VLGHRPFWHLASQAEVGDDEVAVLRDEQVRGLEVAVHDAVRVREAQAAQQLVKEVLEVRIPQGLRGLDDAVQVGVEQLADDVQLVLFAAWNNASAAGGGGGMDGTLQPAIPPSERDKRPALTATP